MIKYRELARRIELEGLGPTCQNLREALRAGEVTLDDFHVRDLAEALVVTRDGSPCGREWVAGFNPSRGESISLVEADGAVDTTAFSNIISQLIFSQVMKAAANQEFIYPKLERVVSTKLRKELIPGLTGITEDIEDDIAEGMPYPQVGYGEDYVETPLTKKKGRILQITKEVIFHNQTALIGNGANGIGDLLGRRREKSFVRCLAGLVNNFNWRGTAYNTYQTSAPWINVKSSNGITVTDGWAKIDAVEQLFGNMVDPNTGEPVTYGIKDIVHTPARNHQFRRVIGASEIRGGQATSGAHDTTISANTVRNYPLHESRYLYSELVASGVSASDAADYWFAGDFQEAIAWVENWPITTTQAPANTEAEFKQDIVAQFKTTMKGVHAVMQPRASVKSYQA